LRIENCTESSGKAAVVIESKSKATFNRTSFKDNKSGAIYIDQKANVTVIGASFDGNEAMNGGAIYINDNSHLEVVNSTFKGRMRSIERQQPDPISVRIFNRNFLGNKAHKGKGGVVNVGGRSILKVHGSVFSSKFVSSLLDQVLLLDVLRS